MNNPEQYVDITNKSAGGLNFIECKAVSQNYWKIQIPRLFAVQKHETVPQLDPYKSILVKTTVLIYLLPIKINNRQR